MTRASMAARTIEMYDPAESQRDTEMQQRSFPCLELEPESPEPPAPENDSQLKNTTTRHVI